tara:strand:- start:508 stop:813 length:306 start_codon:yes stop_codon:yes gene_type:complete
MARPIRKGKRTKRTYLGSGAGSLRSGTGTTAKKPRTTGGYIKKKFPKPVPKKIEWPKKAGPFPTQRTLPSTGPATGLGRVFEKAKKQRKRMATTMRRRAKR